MSQTLGVTPKAPNTHTDYKEDYRRMLRKMNTGHGKRMRSGRERKEKKERKQSRLKDNFTTIATHEN